MKVKNDFPDVDLTLKKLRRFVQTVEELKEKEEDNEKIKDYESDLVYVDQFIDSIEKYLDCVCNSDARVERMRKSGAEIKDIQDFAESEDKRRTHYHSSIIMSMIMIDRLSQAYGLSRVFDYAEEFSSEYSELIPSTREQKAKMTERARIKRREMGNFGLYIAATVTAGMNREYMISDDEAREFASCESDKSKTNYELHRSVVNSSNKLKGNMRDIVK